MSARHVVIIGAGPADLMAAEQLAAAGHRVDVFDAMPSVARKLLIAGGLRIHTRHRWHGWRGESETPTSDLRFDGPEGGGSWSRLGSDGAWGPWLQARGVDVSPLRPANYGFEVSVPTGNGTG